MSGNVAHSVTFEQLAHVDEAMRTRGWNAKIVEDLARELDVDRRTVYRIRARARAWTQKQLRPADLDAWRVQQVQFLGETAIRAANAGEYRDAARCIDIQAKIIGTIAPTKVEHSGHVSVVHSAAAARVSHLTDAQIMQAAFSDKPAIEAAFEEVHLGLPQGEPADEPSR